MTYPQLDRMMAGTVIARPAFEMDLRAQPVPWARAGQGGGFTFTPAKQRHAAQLLQLEAGRIMGDTPPFEGPLWVEMFFAYAWPKSFPKRRRPTFRESKPDIDNLVKLVGDALNNVVWRDDSQIVELRALKIYGLVPRIHITVRFPTNLLV